MKFICSLCKKAEKAKDMDDIISKSKRCKDCRNEKLEVINGKAVKVYYPRSIPRSVEEENKEASRLKKKEERGPYKRTKKEVSKKCLCGKTFITISKKYCSDTCKVKYRKEAQEALNLRRKFDKCDQVDKAIRTAEVSVYGANNSKKSFYINDRSRKNV